MPQIVLLSSVTAGTTLDLMSDGIEVIAEGASLGHPAENPMYARTADGDLILATGYTRDVREVQLPLLVTGTDQADLQAKLDELDNILRNVSRYSDGELQYRSPTGTTTTRFRILHAKRTPATMLDYEAFSRARVVISLATHAFGLPETADLYDPFSTDTLGTGGIVNIGGSDWTADGGALTNGAVSGGVVDAVANLSTTNRWIHVGRGSYEDVAVQLKYTVGATLSGFNAGVIIRRIDANNYLYACVRDDGAATYLRIRKVVAGVDSDLANVVQTRLVAGSTYWLRCHVNGGVVTAQNFTSEPFPTTSSTPTGYELTTAEQATFMVPGSVGIYWAPIETTASIDDFKAWPLYYHGVTFPAVLRLGHDVRGTHDALAGVHYTIVGGTAPTCMLYSWWPKLAIHNYVDRGDAETFSSAAVADGWVATAVTGIISAATSVVRTTTALKFRSGVAGYEAVTPATTDTGVSYAIHRRGGFRAGVTYTAQCYVKSTGGSTTAVRMKLGAGAGNVGTGTASALTSSWAMRTVTWTPTSDVDLAYVAIGVNAATATTFQFDDVMVFEGTTAPTFEKGGFGPGFIPSSAGNVVDGDGAAWVATTDTDYLVGSGLQATGSLAATGSFKVPILPHLFTPDDYTDDEVDVSVYARIEVASTQTSLNCTISMAPDRGTLYGARRYGSFGSGGKALVLPSSGTVFKAVYLGKLTLKVNRSKPRREWMKLTFTNSGGATGTVGVDYLLVVPTRNTASSQRGQTDDVVPDFIQSGVTVTKVVGVDASGEVTGRLTGSIIEHENGGAFTPDDGLLGEMITLSPGRNELLVWPSNHVIDLPTIGTTNMAKTFAGSVMVEIQPRVHLLDQGEL